MIFFFFFERENNNSQELGRKFTELLISELLVSELHTVNHLGISI